MSRRSVFNLSEAIDSYKESKDKENFLKKENHVWQPFQLTKYMN